MPIEIERRGHVAVLTMADQPKRNALSFGLIAELLEAIAKTRAEGVRALVIASSATVFSAGADLSAMSQEPSSTTTAPPKSPLDLFEALTKETRPIIAAVNGGAYGGGFELTLSCDMIVASEKSFFVMPELGHGILPNTALARLPALIGIPRAKELAYTRRKLGAAEAQALGLVCKVVAEDPVSAAVEIATSIVGTAPPRGIAEAKAQFERWIATDWDWARSGRSRSSPEERKEGTTAFVEKRAPDYERFWRAQ
jgi:enoyl-CoA hydratase/carnithine racemase